jgi:hypothetical protein
MIYREFCGIRLKATKNGAAMGKLFLLVLVFMCQACMTLTPIELSPDTLHQRLAAGELIKPGDDVKIVTLDGRHHEFTVTEINQMQIRGKEMALNIEDIIAVENKEFSWGKTAALVGGTYLVVLGILVATVSGAFIM